MYFHKFFTHTYFYTCFQFLSACTKHLLVSISASSTCSRLEVGPHLESNSPSSFRVIMVPLLFSIVSSLPFIVHTLLHFSLSLSLALHNLLLPSLSIYLSLSLLFLFLTSNIDCIYLFVGYYCYRKCTLTCLFLIIIIILLSFPFPFISCLK